MEEQNVIGWADFPCANHARNLHFDAFNRGFTAWVKETLGPALEVLFPFPILCTIYFPTHCISLVLGGKGTWWW